ncbi:hypothetical protein, partial [Aeromonas sp. L_1B5_3]
EEEILRTKSGADLVTRLHAHNPWLICSLVHKFGRTPEGESDDEDDGSSDDFIADMRRSLPSDFSPKGQLFVFV